MRVPDHPLLPFDAARYLRDEQAIAEYIEAVIECGDPALLHLATDDVERALVLHPRA